MERFCTVVENGVRCGKDAVAHGLCGTHYQRVRRSSNPRKRSGNKLEDGRAVYTRVSPRTDAVIEYKLATAQIADGQPPPSRYDLARQWLEERAAKEPDPPKDFVEQFEQDRADMEKEKKTPK